MNILSFRTLKYAALIFILVAASFITYKGYRFYLSLENDALDSCTESIASLLSQKIDEEEIKNVIKPNQNWRVLSSEEQDFLFDSIKSSKHFDCGRFQSYKSGKTQSGERVKVSVREVIDKRNNSNYVGVKIECDECHYVDSP